MKSLLTLVLALFLGVASAQTYTPMSCAMSIPENNSGAFINQWTVGVPYSSHDGDAKAFFMTFGVKVPAGPITSAKWVFSTGGTGAGEAYSGTFNLVTSPQYSADAVCTYGGPYAPLAYPPTINKKTKKPSTDTIVLSTVTTPLQTGDVEFPITGTALAALRAAAGDPAGISLALSMVVPRISIPVPGDDPKKVNQVGYLMFANWQGYGPAPCAAGSQWANFCPKLVTQ